MVASSFQTWFRRKRTSTGLRRPERQGEISKRNPVLKPELLSHKSAFCSEHQNGDLQRKTSELHEKCPQVSQVSLLTSRLSSLLVRSLAIPCVTCVSTQFSNLTLSSAVGPGPGRTPTSRLVGQKIVQSDWKPSSHTETNPQSVV